MLARHIGKILQKRLSSYPAVALVGPRQSGKTTLAGSLGGKYFDLEQEPDRLRLDLEWDNLVGSKALIILDEAHAWPEIFPRLRGAIDHDRKRFHRFLLLGSVSPSLMTRVSESLAGRLSIMELTPLLLSELKTEASRKRLWMYGGYSNGPKCIGAIPAFSIRFSMWRAKTSYSTSHGLGQAGKASSSSKFLVY